MATVNLGQIKPVFKGAYNNSTAYVLDNIVTSGGSSYICILASTGNAVSNGTYWSTLAAGTGDASDLTSGTLPIARIADDAITLAKMADDAIGVAQLSASGTASSSTFLRGDNTWTGAGKVLQMKSTYSDDIMSASNSGSPSNSNAGVEVWNFTFTPTSSTSKLLIQTSSVSIHEEGNNGDKTWLALWLDTTFQNAVSGNAKHTSFTSALQYGVQSLN